MNSITVETSSPKTRSKVHKFMTLFLQFLQIFIGSDLGFFEHKSKKFQFILKIYPCIQYFILLGLQCVLMYDSEMDFNKFWTFLYFIEYSLTFLLLSRFKSGTTFRDLYCDLEAIDVKLQFDSSRYHSEIKFISCIVFSFIDRLFITSLYCLYSEHCMKPLWYAYAFVLVTSCTDISLICYSFIFYSVNLRLKKLASILEAEDDFDSIQRMYKTIVDTVEKYKTAFDPLYVLMLLFNVPQVMATVYFTLITMQNAIEKMSILGVVAEYFHMLEVLALTIAPALFAESLTTQADNIKCILHEKRLLRDVRQRGSIMQFIQYVDARPCRFRVWKVIPLSADLLGMVLSFCVTYLIVILQFTHTY